MSRIFKSSYVNIGAIKEIHANKVIQPSDIQLIEESEGHEAIDLDALYEEKLKEAELQIQLKLAEAQKQAEDIIQQARKKATEVLENAKNEGYREGKELGFTEGKLSANALIEEALQIKAYVQSKKISLVKEVEKDVNALIIQIVESILNTKIDDSEDIIIGLVKLGLDKCTYTDHLIIRVSPEDYGFTISSKDKILCLAENISDLEIRQDASLKKGSCVIDTISGSVDSSIETQLQHVKEIFLELLESE
ncbi:FliH/SctL family protein [Anaerosolibacter sp.]|uniref:FliH/SctL family protein n=1 Tax=Anaerosolibacter sp. TaxID=1872527 RepID=UPI0039F139C3